jgi:hypothetical protein
MLIKQVELHFESKYLYSFLSFLCLTFACRISNCSYLSHASTELGLKSFVPCHGDVSCFVFDIDERKVKKETVQNMSVVAGHFAWNVWSKLPGCKAPYDRSCRPSCFVIGRHPVHRIISYYYQRLYLEASSPYYRKKLSNVDPATFEDVIVSHRFARFKDNDTSSPSSSTSFSSYVIVDEGMSNAFCRTILNKRTSTGKEQGETVELPEDLNNEKDILEAIDHVKRCVIGIQEQWNDTLKVIDYWFPWIFYSETTKNNRLNEGERNVRESPQDLPSELLKAIESQNQCDLRVYEVMISLFQNQLHAVGSSNYFVG